MTFRAAIPVLALALPALAHLAAPSCGKSASSSGSIRVDLDLALPPGTPLDLTRALPHTPVGPPRSPTTPSTAANDGERRTISTPQSVDIAPSVPGSFALLRILTWDLTAHIGWLGEVRRPFWWMTLAPLLRLLLHPQLVSEAETQAHLIELGEAALPALEAARSEKALFPLCAEIATRIGRPDRHAPAPLRHADPDQALWLRYVAEQLVERHPHDPELGFGEKLYLFGERAAPAVAAYLVHDHAFLRRNAVVALERIGGRVALAALAEQLSRTTDAVQWCRIALALGRRRHVPALDELLAQLARAEEPWRVAVLFHALGSIGEPRAAEPVARRARACLGDPDLVMAALVALARMPQREAPDAVRGFLDAVRRESATRWHCEDPPPDYAPDRHDAPDARHLALLQLESIARSAAAPADAERAEVLFGWLRAPDTAAAERPFTGLEGATGTLSRVLAPARLAFLEQLARLGERGRNALLVIARDAQIDPELRVQALRFAPFTERVGLAARLAEDTQADGALRIAALEILTALRPSELGDVAARIAAPLLLVSDLDALDATKRFLLRRAMEALGAAGGERGLELLLAWAGRRSVEAPPSAKLEDALRAQVAALVSLVAEKRSVRAAEQEIADVVDIAISKRLSPVFRVENRAQAVARVQALLEGLRSNPAPSYRALVADSIANELLGRVLSAAQVEVVFAPRIPLGDALCSELARRNAAATQLALLRRLQDPQSVERGYAALALGGVPARVGGAHLLVALDDRELFVRLCAAVALERLTGEPNRCDWFAASAAARAEAVEIWRAALERRR
jgi:hypothetical protein